VERAGMWFCAWRSRKLRVCLLIEMAEGEDFLKVVEKIWEKLYP